MAKTNDNNKQRAFIIPYHGNAYDQLNRKEIVMADTIEGLFSQTDEDWNAFIIADATLNPESYDYLNKLRQQ